MEVRAVGAMTWEPIIVHIQSQRQKTTRAAASTHHTQRRHQHLSVPVLLKVYAFPQSSHLLAAQPDLLDRQTWEHIASVAALIWIHCRSRGLSSVIHDVNQLEASKPTPPSDYAIDPFLS